MQDSPKRGVGVEPKNGGRTDSHGFAETHFPESCRTNFLRSIMRLRWIAAIHYRKIQYSGELCIFSGDLLRCRGPLWRSRRFIYHIFMRFIWPQVERNGTQKWVSWVVWNQKKVWETANHRKPRGPLRFFHCRGLPPAPVKKAQLHSIKYECKNATCVRPPKWYPCHPRQWKKRSCIVSNGWVEHFSHPDFQKSRKKKRS